MKRIVRLPLALGIAGSVCLTSSLEPSVRGDGWCCQKNPAPAYPVGPPIPVNPVVPSGNAMNSFYGNYGQVPPSPGGFLPAGLPQTSAAVFPTAAYDTQWLRTPVTYYRPVTQFDPNYGTTVTTLQPCTSYQYQAQRVPLVAPQVIPHHSANRWPAVTAPGYYPTGLAPTAAGIPVYPTLQQVPAAGMPVRSNMPSYTSSGTSTGPASTLPLATMSSPSGVAPALFTAPNSFTAPNTSNAFPIPAAATPASTWALSSGVPVASSFGTMTSPTQANCPNGVCAVPSTQSSSMPVPSIPGAASVTPLGPPTILASPPASTSFPNPQSMAPQSMAPQPMAPSPILPGLGDTNPVLPPGAGDNDPEATRQPSLGTSANLAPPAGNVAGTMYPLKRLPIVEIDRNPPATSNASNSAPTLDNRNPFVEHSTERAATKLVPPPILPPAMLKPLQAPSDYDAKPRWNPKLLPPADPSARETVA